MASPASPISASTRQESPPLTVARLLVTIHGLFDMPRAMAQLDSRQEQIEIVLKPTAKYYYNDRRVTQLELPERAITFSPSAILYRNERFVLDCDNPATLRGISRANSIRNSLSDAIGPSSSVALGGAHNSTPAALPTAADEGAGHAVAMDGDSHSDPSNKIMLQYPTRADLKVIVDVLVSVRQRRIGSSAVRWITLSSQQEIRRSTFSAAEGEVARHKVINRFVGLTVGHLSCTISLPYVNEDLRRLPESANLYMQAAAERLERDLMRLRRLYLPAGGNARAGANGGDGGTAASGFLARLRNGEKESSIFTGMLLNYDPHYYTRRVQRILEMYPPPPHNIEFANASAETLVAEHAGREEELILHLCAELGPELSSISPRTRRMVYRWYYELPEEKLLACVTAKYGTAENLLDYEPDLYMQAVAEAYGPELLPTVYHFPAIEYVRDQRTFFCDTLRFPVNRPEARYRDLALAARNQRVPLQLTPNERPLEGRTPGVPLGEIDILMEKYKAEFNQIVPSILDAIETVVTDNERIANSIDREGLDERFDHFNVERATYSYMPILTQLSTHTYISPSSLLSSLIFLDRLCLRHPKLLITRANMEKLLIIGVRVANKVVDLRGINNRNFAGAFSIPVTRFNKLEEYMLKLIDFDLFLSPEEFNSYAGLLLPPSALTQMQRSIRRTTTGVEPTTDSQDDVVTGPGPSQQPQHAPPPATTTRSNAPAGSASPPRLSETSTAIPTTHPRANVGLASSYDGASARLLPVPPMDRPGQANPVRCSLSVAASTVGGAGSGIAIVTRGARGESVPQVTTSTLCESPENRRSGVSVEGLSDTNGHRLSRVSAVQGSHAS